MPNCGSWNGRWSGDKNLFARVVSFPNSKAGNLKAAKILQKTSYYYSFGDGWGASIAVRKVETAEANSIKRRSKGFCGYEWMIQSIRDHGKIYSTPPVKTETAVQS